MSQRPPVTGDRPFVSVPNSIVETLAECLRYFAHHDQSNAAIHCGNVRYSPLTFRLAECLELIPGANLESTLDELLEDVLAHHGTYAEDKGRTS